MTVVSTFGGNGGRYWARTNDAQLVELEVAGLRPARNRALRDQQIGALTSAWPWIVTNKKRAETRIGLSSRCLSRGKREQPDPLGSSR